MDNKYCKWILEVLTDIYIFVMIICFPLIIGPQGYSNILDVKYFSYAIITVFYLLAVIGVLLYFFVKKKYNYFFYNKFGRIRFLLLIFLFINILSFIFSPYKEYNLFLGLGRGEGLFNIILYSLSLISVSLFFKFDKKIFNYISISVILVSLIAFLEYIGFNPFYIYKGHTGPFNMSYMTTFGNKGVLSAFYTIMITISFGAYVFLKNDSKSNLLHLLSMFIGIFIFSVINVDSGLVAFLVSLMVIFPFVLLNNKYLSKCMIVGALVCFGFMLNYVLNPVYRYSTRIYQLELQFDKYALLLLICTFLFIGAFYYIRNHGFEIKNKKSFLKKIYILYPITIIGVLGCVYFNDFNIPLLNSVQQILHGNFSDDIGTYRLFLWKRTFNLVGDYPLLGSGPDTFSYRFMSEYWYDVLLLDHKITINDTAANVYLTMLINIGVIGLISYLSYLVMLLKELFVNIKNTSNVSLIFLLGIICFMVQDFFNLSVVIVTPIFYVIMGVAISCIDTRKV